MKNKSKSRRIILKRFIITKNKKVLRKCCNTSHLNRKEDTSTRHRKDKLQVVKGKARIKIIKMLG